MQSSLLADSGLSKMYWGEATLTACYLLNRLWTSALGKIPYYVLYGKQPSLAHLRIFGSSAYVHIPKAIRRKGQAKARRMIFLGYEAGSKSYRFTLPGSGRITFSRSANFMEQNWERVKDSVHLPEGSDAETQQPRQRGKGSNSEAQNLDEEKDNLDFPTVIVNSQENEGEQTELPVTPRRSERVNKGVPPERYSPASVCQVTCEPQSYGEMLKQPQAEQLRWKAAMDREMQSMIDNKVFARCQLPPGKKVIGCRWVYKQKTLSDGNLQHKARLVAKGFTQKENIHFGETYAPTVRGESVRIALVLAAKLDLKVKHYDFTTAYLNANLDEELYMSEPPGYNTQPGMVWKLDKAIYGLRQSGFNWHRCLDSALQRMGFRAARADSCVYTLQQGDVQVYLLIHVDDLLIIAKTEEQIEQIALNLKKEFQLKDLGEIKNYLGVEVQKLPGQGYVLRQQQKIEHLLESLSMQQCKPAKTPMATDFLKDIGEQEDSEVEYCNKERYQSAIGSLLYLAQWSRPDITAAVNILSRHVSEPTERHWQGVKRVLRYLKGTATKGLTIQPVEALELVAYSDASWADEITSRKSTSGMIVTLGGALVGWRARRQSCVSLSSSEAEFSALSEVCTELIWYQQLLKDLQIDVVQPFTVWDDSETCIAMATSPRVKGRSKHVDIRYCNVREAVQNKLVKLIYCPSEQNKADIMTKALGTIKHNVMCKLLGMSDDV